MPTRSQESSRMNTVSSLGLLVAVLVAVTVVRWQLSPGRLAPPRLSRLRPSL